MTQSEVHHISIGVTKRRAVHVAHLIYTPLSRCSDDTSALVLSLSPSLSLSLSPPLSLSLSF